jgi:hypothetical protein
MRGSPLLDWWWGFFVAGALSGRILSSLINDESSPSGIRTFDRLAAASKIITLVGAVLAALTVRAMTARADVRAAAVRAPT